MNNRRYKMSYYETQDKVLSVFLKTTKKASSIVSLFKKNLPHKVFYKYQKKEIKKHKVFLECSHGRNISGNIFSICQWFSENLPNYELVVSARDVLNISNKLKGCGINAKVVKWYSIEYMQHLATSKYIFNDTTFYPFFIKRTGQVYTNTWHGTPLKQLGIHLDNPVASGNVQKNFLLSDYIWVNNRYTEDKLISAYQLDGIYKGNMITGPSPRNSVLYNDDVRSRVRKKIAASNKKVIFYMPTWRDQYGVGKAMPRACEQYKFLDFLESSLPEGYTLYYKLHDYVKDTYMSKLGKVQKVPQDIELYDFLSASDVLITDYSSVMFDYIGTGRSVYLYVYDIEDYLQDRGLYQDIDSLPFFKYHEANDLLNGLVSKESHSSMYSDEVLKKYTPFDGNKIDSVLNHILEIPDNKKMDFLVRNISNKKKNIGIYAGGLWDNGITISLMNLISSFEGIKQDESLDNNYIVFCEANRIENKHFYKVRNIAKQVHFFPIIGKYQGGGIEKLLYYGYLKISAIKGNLIERVVKSLYQREYDRTLGALNLDHAVHYTGYDRKQAAVFAFAEIKEKTIYVHNDMFEEYKLKKNFNKKIIFTAYRKFQNIALVNKELIPGFSKNMSKVVKNIKLAPNFVGKDRVIRLAEENVEDVLHGIDIHYSDSIYNEDDVRKEKSHDGQFDAVDRILRLLKDDSVKVFINIGRFSPEKGQERLIKAFENHYRTNSDCALVIIGGYGDDLEVIISRCKESVAKNRIFVLGSTPNPFPILKACDAFILSSKYEGLGLVVFEAAALNVPVITVDLPVVTRYIGNAAIIVDNSIEGLESGIQEFYSTGGSKGKVDFDKLDAEALIGMETIYKCKEAK